MHDTLVSIHDTDVSRLTHMFQMLPQMLHCSKKAVKTMIKVVTNRKIGVVNRS